MLAGAACSSTGPYAAGRKAARAGQWDVAVDFYQRAVAEAPDDVEYRIALERARLEASRVNLRDARARSAAGDIDEAIATYEIALAYDPTNRYVRDELDELQRRNRRPPAAVSRERVTPFRTEDPVLDPSSPEPIHVEFPAGTSLRTVLESLGELAGVNLLFDESFRDRRVAVDLEGVSYREVLDILMQSNGLFYKVVGSVSVVGNR